MTTVSVETMLKDCTARKIPFMYSCLGIAQPQSQFLHSCVCERLYIPRIGPHISCIRIGRSIVGIYKSITDTWMWKLGLWPRKSFSGNICFLFSVLVLCSVWLFLLLSRRRMQKWEKTFRWPWRPSGIFPSKHKLLYFHTILQHSSA